MTPKKENKIKAIVEGRDYKNMVGHNRYPIPGEYYITGIQHRNIHGEQGWGNYIGHVVQVRLGAGAFGSHLVLMRHPHGGLASHENQSFFKIGPGAIDKVKGLFSDGDTPDFEDYNEAYSVAGKYPEFGKIVPPGGSAPPADNSPMVQITVTHPDGSKDIEVC